MVENAAGLGNCLAEADDLYRATPYGGGLILASTSPNIPPTPIKDAAQLAAVIADRQRVRVIKNGNITGNSVPTKHLKTLLSSEAFLRQFPPVDIVESRSRYLPDFILTRPGYNDGGYGQRILHIGEEPWIELTHDYVERFLDVMAFATEADRTNAVAAALTVMLRNFWPGAKPCLVVTSTKSHGGKETIVTFAAGTARLSGISYQAADWALERAFVGAVKHDPDVGLIDVENARLQRGQKEIRSAFLERFLTDPEPLLFSTGTGAAGPPPQRDRRRDHDQLRHRLGGPDEPGPADPPGPRRRRRRPRLADRQPQAGVPPPQSRPDRGRAAGHDRATGRGSTAPSTRGSSTRSAPGRRPSGAS